jgi:hypothetical protein
MGFPAMDSATFCNLVLSEFPSLREDIEEWEGLIHLQVSEFLRFTQSAIESRSFEVVTKCFELADAALAKGDDNLRNAIYVSYLEHLNLRSDPGKRAAQLMSVELKQGREDILDYDRELLGRKWPVDDRE